MKTTLKLAFFVWHALIFLVAGYGFYLLIPSIFLSLFFLANIIFLYFGILKKKPLLVFMFFVQVMLINGGANEKILLLLFLGFGAVMLLLLARKLLISPHR